MLIIELKSISEMLSEAVKILKAEYCIRAIEKYKMDKALIFCRTKLDCDNLENYFTSLGGGPRARDPNHQFSCKKLSISFHLRKLLYYVL